MKKLIKPIVCAAVAAALAAGMQITTLAALDTDTDRTSSISSASEKADLNEDTGVNNEISAISENETSSRLADEANPTTTETTNNADNARDANEIPDTGMESIAIPSVVALLAAATAALTFKKK